MNIDKRTFQLHAVHKADQRVSWDAVREAAGEVWELKKGDVYQADLAAAIQRATQSPRPSVEQPMVPESPESRITKDLLLKRIEPLVTETREAIFGSPEPPFQSLEAAAEWLESQRRERNLPSVPWKEIDSLAERLHRRFSALELKNFAVNYVRPGEEWVRAVVVTNENLHRLRLCTERIAENTGFVAATVTGYILAGIQPVIPRVTRRKLYFHGWDHQLGKALPRFAVTFYSRDVTLKELKSLYRRYCEGLPGASLSKGRKPLSRSDERLYRAIQRVNERTEPEKRRGRAYYESIKQLWRPQTTWQTVKTQKWRLNKKLKALGIAEEGL